METVIKKEKKKKSRDLMETERTFIWAAQGGYQVAAFLTFKEVTT